MPDGRDFDDTEGEAGPKPGLWDRFRSAVQRPGTQPAPAPDTRSVEELEVAVKRADDKERLVGLIAAPLAAAIGFLIIAALIDNDPPAYLKDGLANHAHVSVSLYHTLSLTLLALSILMIVAALLRKRLILGILLALYGLGVFNLHYWGFGVPFILGGAWLLVRQYRLNHALRDATDDGTTPTGARRRSSSTSTNSMPAPNKRYTPPASSPKRT